MNRIIPVLAFCAFFFSGFSAARSQATNEMKAVDYFKAVRSSVTANLPGQFTSELTGRSIDAKMKNIPPDSILDGSRKVFVQLAYSKKSGIAVVVKNVDELYQDLYRDLPKQIFAFDLILSSENNDPFLKKYDISYYSRSAALIVLRLGIRSAENGLLLFIRPENLQIQRIDYTLGKQLLSSTIITYTETTNNGKRYVIPFRFISKTMDAEGRSRPETFEINSLRIQAK